MKSALINTIVWSILVGLAIVAWYRPFIEVVAYLGLVLVGLWTWGSIVRGKPKAAEPSAKDKVLADIDIPCEVDRCDKVSEIECLGISLCYRHWRLLRPKGMKCLWGFKQKEK